MNNVERMSLECAWKEQVRIMIEREGNQDPYAWIMAGLHIVEAYNKDSNDQSEDICFLSHITQDVMNQSLWQLVVPI